MKYFFLFVSLFLILSCEKKDLTDKEILEIIHADEKYDLMELKTDFSYGEDFIDSIKLFKNTVEKENFSPIYKADFNNDGKADYLVNLKYNWDKNGNDILKIHIEDDSKACVLLLSNPKGYEILNPGKAMIYSIIGGKIINRKGQYLIQLLNFNNNYNGKNNLLRFDTLKVNNGELIEFSKNFSENKIQNIIFTQYGGYNPDVEYSLSVKKDSLTLNSKYYQKLQGKYKVKDSSEFLALSNYLNSINFKSLKNHYYIRCHDCSAIETKIIYDNGKVKTIYDYGEKGSLGLLKFYDSIHAIMEKKKWQKIK